MKPMRSQRGYTVIELMIVTFLIGLLCAIAIPAFTDYLVRSKIAEALTVAGAAKTSVTDFYNTMAILPPDNIAAGLSPPDQTATQYVSSITITDGIIGIAVRGHPLIDGTTIQLTPDATPARVDWNCSGGTLPTRFRPAPCRD